MRRCLLIGCAAVFALVAQTGTAWAGGFEYGPSGVQSLGRGGAFAARVDDPLALQYNPANLAILASPQLSIQTQLAFFGGCFQRTGTPGADSLTPDNYTDAGDPVYDDVQTRFGVRNAPPPGGYMGIGFPQVCEGGLPGPGASLLFGMPIGPRLGIAFGVLTPAAVGAKVWGRSSDQTVGVAGAVSGRMPSPGRYMLGEENLIILYPTIGAGYQVAPWMRLGLALSWGVGSFDFTNMTQPASREPIAADIRTKLHATDLFIPRATVSLDISPIDALEIVGSFTWTDDVHAGGNLDLTAGYYEAMRDPAVDGHANIQHAVLDAPQPWQATLAVRYADRITPRPTDQAAASRLSGRVEDRMSTERFDVEADAVLELNARVDKFVLNLPQGSTLLLQGSLFPIPSVTNLPHHWQDQVDLRLGGDYNVIPGKLAFRAGVSFETRGVDKSYTQIDFMPLMRFGIHAGMTVRFGRLDLSAAYAHIFQESIDVSPSEAKLPEVVAVPTPGVPVTFVNAGHYSSQYDVVALGGNYHF